MNHSFEIRVPGKWVLSGEHAVLRGVEAVALPHPVFGLGLSYRATDTELRIETGAGTSDQITSLLELLKPIPEVPKTGHLIIRSGIPLASGLGSSAALCVALARWLKPEPGEFSEFQRGFATRLEDHFHGRSSGMDIAAVSSGGPIAFKSGHPPRRLQVSKMPNFTFHDTGLRASTKGCVAQVQALFEADSTRGRKIDLQMSEAGRLAQVGLESWSRSPAQATALLAQAMDLGQECFENWGLVPDRVRQQVEDLKKPKSNGPGARAVKLTGAGAGGFLVALWDQ